MNLPLRVVSETATTLTLGWDPVAGAEGYVFRTGNGVKSHTMDATRKTVKFAKGFEPYTVTALGVLAVGSYSETAAKFGVDLPKRYEAYVVGAPVEATTLTQLRNALLGSTAGGTVKLTAPLDLGGQDLVLNRAYALTVDLAAPVSNGRVLISRAAYLNLRFTDLGHSPTDGIKITDGSHHIDVDGHGGTIHDTGNTQTFSSGILQTDTACHDWQIWNVRLKNCGKNTNKDHSIYIHDSRKVDAPNVLASIISEQPLNYGLQAYSDCRDLIVTAFENHGSRNGRGGIVVGNEPGLSSERVNVYGPVFTGTGKGIEQFNTAKDSHVYDGISDGATFDAAFQPVNCATSGSTTAHAIDPARYGMLPPTRIDGRPQTGMAGAA